MKAQTAIDLSYRVREAIATELGEDLHRDFSVNVDATPIACQFADGSTALLQSTTNAGFRGIEGWFVQEYDRDGLARRVSFSRSLGEIVEWDIAR